MVKILSLTQRYEDKWNKYLSRSREATIFHTIEWKNTVSKTYGYVPHHVLAEEDSIIKGVLPLFLVRSYFYGNKLTSVPFSFYCPPLYDDVNIGIEMLKYAIRKMKKMGAKCLEIKCLNPTKKEKIKSTFQLSKKLLYFDYELRLSQNYSDVFCKYSKRFRGNLRAIRRKTSNKVKLREAQSAKDIEDFYEIMVSIYKTKHYIIPQPLSLFLNLQTNFYKNRLIRTYLATLKGKIIAGIVLSFYNDKVMYLWGASKSEFASISPTTILLDVLIRKSCEDGYKTFYFGPTNVNQENLIFYKTRWGGEQKEIVGYYSPGDILPTYDFENSSLFLRQKIKYLPNRLIKLMAPFIVKHFG